MFRDFRPRPKVPRFSGPPRVRYEPPTIAEAVSAAQDLAGEVEHQVAIVAGLMGLPEEVRPHVLSIPATRPVSRALPNVVRPSSAPQVVIVRRRAFRSA